MLEYKESIAATNTEINIDQLPEISGYPYQITLIFRHLFSNALKYRKLGHPLFLSHFRNARCRFRHRVGLFPTMALWLKVAAKNLEVFSGVYRARMIMREQVSAWPFAAGSCPITVGLLRRSHCWAMALPSGCIFRWRSRHSLFATLSNRLKEQNTGYHHVHIDVLLGRYIQCKHVR